MFVTVVSSALSYDETFDLSRYEQLSICLSYVLDVQKRRHLLDSLTRSRPMGSHTTNWWKRVMGEMILAIHNIVGMLRRRIQYERIHKGLATLTKITSPLVVYVNCYGYLLNLTDQYTVEETEPLRNALGIG